MRSALPTLLLCLLAAAAAGEPAPSPFDRTLRLELWGKHLGDAVSQITERGGVDLRVAAGFIKPKEFPTRTLWLQADRITVRQAVEWLARALDCRYRIDGPTSVKLSGSYEWLQEPEEILIEPVEPLVGKLGAKPFEDKLSELVKVASLFQNCSLRLEEPDLKLVAILPKRLRNILGESLTAMQRTGLPLRPPAERRLGEMETELLQALRKQVVARYREQDAAAVLRDLSLQSGLLIGFDHRPFLTRPVPPITLDLGQTTVRQALEGLAAALGLKGCELWPPHCVWLTAEPRKWTPAAGRAFLWEELQVRSYAIGPLLKAWGGGEVVALQVRRRAVPNLWADPSTAVVFHPVSANLIVVAPEEAQDAVLRELCILQTSDPKQE